MFDSLFGPYPVRSLSFVILERMKWKTYSNASHVPCAVYIFLFCDHLRPQGIRRLENVLQASTVWELQ